MTTTEAPRCDPAPSVQAVLERVPVPYAVVRHTELPEPVRSPADVARQLACHPESIAKTLLVTDPTARGSERAATNAVPAASAPCALVVVPAPWRAELDRVADALGWRRASLAPPAVLHDRLGQPPGGVSPIGDHGLPVIAERTLAAGAPILVGSGTIGVELRLHPQDLVRATGAVLAAVGARPADPAVRQPTTGSPPDRPGSGRNGTGTGRGTGRRTDPR